MPDQRDAQVSVIEGQTGMVMVGAGVASDSGVIGQMVFEQRNFDIKDWPENFTDFITGQAFKGAGQNMKIALEPGTEVSQYSISFTEPYFKDKPISLDVVGSSWDGGGKATMKEEQRDMSASRSGTKTAGEEVSASNWKTLRSIPSIPMHLRKLSMLKEIMLLRRLRWGSAKTLPMIDLIRVRVTLLPQDMNRPPETTPSGY